MLTLRNQATGTHPFIPTGAAGLPPPIPAPLAASGDDGSGDILYGARAIALFLFGSDDRRAIRRVFNLWAHYQHRKEKVGLFKLKGALCLAKSQWRAFRG